MFIPVTPYLASNMALGRTCKVLHLAPPAMTAWLLDRGESPNRPDSHGSTPLDYVLESVYGASSLMAILYERCSILVGRGGRPHGTAPSVWWKALEQFAKLQMPIDDLALRFRSWAPQELEGEF